ncbi:TetR/AcrR family transcriptional regulator [Streptomyces fuscigenes]|uniref:TetR/AcrR family transcriptional regulator n=1 Tax=Streptomyces fuscigenes TaxID=1528880 RepID=UPI001F44F840|nr:TetR/AcrR family transcriptional regulator [Streptomyces fuscigenes]MCF3963659.1 TetR/AcrR family transcriptional regulator [Streptomyces fuscigenes]
MGRTSDARDKILAAAEKLFEERGYSALGVAEICSAAGVPKGSFYYFFDSKQALALTVIDEHWQVQRRDWKRLLDADLPPLRRLHDLFVATEAVQRVGQGPHGSVTGCLFGNLTLELSTRHEDVRVRLQEIFDEQIAMIETVVAEARARGEAPKVTDTHAAARSIVAQLEGQVLFAKLLNDPAQVAAVWGNCLAMLGAPADTVVTGA